MITIYLYLRLGFFKWQKLRPLEYTTKVPNSKKIKLIDTKLCIKKLKGIPAWKAKAGWFTLFSEKKCYYRFVLPNLVLNVQYRILFLPTFIMLSFVEGMLLQNILPQKVLMKQANSNFRCVWNYMGGIYAQPWRQLKGRSIKKQPPSRFPRLRVVLNWKALTLAPAPTTTPVALEAGLLH